MYRFIESIRVEEKKIWNLLYHNERLNATRNKVLNCKVALDLSKEISLPHGLDGSCYKCRVIYSEKIESIQFLPYRKKSIKSLKVIESTSLNYSYKFENREELQKLFGQKEQYDDVLITQKGLVTDTSYCNIAFYDGETWHTPEKPLLQGTMREYLLQSNKINTKAITVNDIQGFKKARVFNALIGWDKSNDIEVKKIG